MNAAWGEACVQSTDTVFRCCIFITSCLFLPSQLQQRYCRGETFAWNCSQRCELGKTSEPRTGAESEQKVNAAGIFTLPKGCWWNYSELKRKLIKKAGTDIVVVTLILNPWKKIIFSPLLTVFLPQNCFKQQQTRSCFWILVLCNKKCFI